MIAAIGPRLRTATTFLMLGFTAVIARAASPIHITHEFTNTNAQSLIGLPMGSTKTIVDKNGNLRWSHWSLKNRPPDSPFGFSNQMDGALDIKVFLAEKSGALIPFAAPSQNLYKARFPFVVTSLTASGVHFEELAFATEAGKQGFDVIRLQAANAGPEPITLEVQLSGKWRNLAGHAKGYSLVTRNGYVVVAAENTGECASKENGLILGCSWTIPSGSTKAFWLKRPYDLMEADLATISGASGPVLLEHTEQFWQNIWRKGMQISLPQKELEDFFYSSFAYVLILTEYDAAGDLWILDGPGGYRQFWGRGEYFQARTLELLGYLDLARQSVEHAFHIQMDDGEWDGPPISGWPSWDNTGGNAGATWDYYLFSRDREWLSKSYPHLIAAARWIRDHREESELESSDAPKAAKPARRDIPWSCKPETNPPLKPGEKPLWYGLLPWSYGDSGLPEGHSYPHNFLALYAIKCALNSAKVLGHSDDVAWLSKEYDDYKSAIIISIERSLKLEKDEPPYLPAMPVAPDAAWSQSFLAVYPAEIFPADHPLISGLLYRVERTARQGLPTNMAWLGPSGVWPGESMNVADIYVRRGEFDKAAAMLVAALNHSYFTNVWKEEIRVDKTLPRACTNESSHKQLENQAGTGDMPEAWGNANLVNLIRDMLLLEEDGVLYVLDGTPSDWIDIGQEIEVKNAPTILGGNVSLRLHYTSAGKMTLQLVPPSTPTDVVVRFPIAKNQTITSVRINGHGTPTANQNSVRLMAIHEPVNIDVQFK